MFRILADKASGGTVSIQNTAEDAMRAVNDLRTSRVRAVAITDEAGRKITESELAMRVMKARFEV